MNLISLDKLTAESQVLKILKRINTTTYIYRVFFAAVIFMVQLFCLYALISSFVWTPRQPNHSLIPDICASILKNDLVEGQLVRGGRNTEFYS